MNETVFSLYRYYMRYCLFFLLLLGFSESWAQAGPRQQTVLLNANEVKFPAVDMNTASVQARTWKLQKDQQPANANAWFNYYLWTARNKQPAKPDKEKKLGEIVKEAAQHIGNTPQYDLMLYLQSGKKDSASMYRVIASGMDKQVFYPYIIQFFVMNKNDTALKKYCLESEASSPLPKDLYQYHYNALMSAGKNSIIYAKGVNDLVPMSILQQVYEVRKDIRLKTYEEMVENGSDSYLSISLGKEVLSKYPKSTYTGLLVKVTGNSAISELKGHIENDFDLSFVSNTNLLSPDAVQLYKNYLPSFILLYNYYKKTGNSKLTGMKDMIEKIAMKAGIGDEITKVLGQ